ncbi:CcmD family protein [Spirosoma taeanense]|uniref:CcmD family protein n=1 Tax=Spirosoma taeanense TaxID=2735870 RepID=A0A6M5Y639_9BACT|nr:CcmD family protein [Spirosoma taeanense]QJW89349.1 CcmD family protein [Spirosoma taeanense]
MQTFSMKKVLLAPLLLLSHCLLAQQPVADGVEMADQLRADGKIWVVVAVIAAVFVGIILYLVRLDRQIGKLEKEIKEKPVSPSVRL